MYLWYNIYLERCSVIGNIAEDVKEDDGMGRLGEKKQNEDAPKRLGAVMNCVSIVLYILLSVLLITMSRGKQSIHIGKVELMTNSVQGVFAQFQLLIAVYLALSKVQTGFYTALVLVTYSFSLTSIYSYVNMDTRPLPGIIAYGAAFLVVNLLHKYKKNMNEQNILLMNQNQMLKKKEKELKQMAFFDDLTKVLNRKMFIGELAMQVENFKHTERKIYVVFIDIDNFKTINDTLGHQIGDFVLIELVERIKKQLHEEDIIGRLGGDEIGLIIMQKIDKKGVLEYLNKIREELMSSVFCQEEKKFTVTSSFGVAEFPKSGTSAEELLKNADSAMYSSKREGRNQVTFFDEIKIEEKFKL
ncbi:GGDEF domain-containing protein [Anaeromicropila populeti]|nr:GGDEF domain-containing protein [Anaeromicropila populeti]